MPNSPDPNELKAGHPPAVKVGNMRVVQRTHSTSSNTSDKNNEDQAGEQTASDNQQQHQHQSGDAGPPQACSFAPKTVVQKPTGGMPDDATMAKVQTEAVKQIHEKPQASHEFRNNPVSKQHHIMQPKK